MDYQHDQANPTSSTNEKVNINVGGDNEDSKVADGRGDETILVDAEPAAGVSGDESLATVRLERLKRVLEEKEAFHQESIDGERDHRIAKLRKELERKRHSCRYCSPCIGNKRRDSDIAVLEATLELQRIK